MRSWGYDEEPIRCREFWPEVHWPTAKRGVVSGPARPGAIAGELRRRLRGDQENASAPNVLHVVLAANEALVLLYWDVGRAILDRQDREGWGAKVIDRLSHDLRDAFPDMRGLSPRNLKYMRAFAAAWPDRAIVQRTVAQIPWRSKRDPARQGHGRANSPVVRPKSP